MSSNYYYYLCLLCFAAALGEEAMTETPAPVKTSSDVKSELMSPTALRRRKPPRPAKTPNETPLPAVSAVLDNWKLDAESRATILGEMEKAKKLEEIVRAKLKEAANASTTLENTATNSTDGKDSEKNANSKKSDDVLIKSVLSAMMQPKPEPSAGSMMRLPLIAALLSFAGVLAYSLVFLFKIFKRTKGTLPKGKAISRISEELDFEDLERAFDVTTSMKQKSDPFPVRKQVQAKGKEVKKAFATVLDNDVQNDAGWGDDLGGWSDFEDVTG